VQACTIDGYSIDLEPLSRALSRASPRQIILQLPDGLKHMAPGLVDCIAKELGVDPSWIVVHGDSVFGACDLQAPKLGMLGDAIIAHVGHTPYPPELASSELLRMATRRTVFLPARSIIPLDDIRDALVDAARIASSYKPSVVALTATSQHAHLLHSIQRELRNLGLNAVIPRGQKPYFEDGQVIGCDYRVARSVKADLFVIVAGGVFHPLGLYLSTLRPVVQVDPYRREASDATSLGERVYRRRLYLISKAMDARTLALIIGLKEGQLRPWLAGLVERRAAEKGVKVYKYAVEYLTPSTLGNIDSPLIDAYVVTSCPRLPIDDFPDFHKPVLTPGEALMALEGRLEPYRFPW